MKITNIMAVSLDGATAAHANESDQERHATQFGNEDDYQMLVAAITACDAVIVGRSTIAASGPIVTKSPAGKCPEWFVLTNRGFDENDPVLLAEVPLTLVSREILPSHNYKNGAKKIIFGSMSPALSVAEHLRKTGKEDVLLLGGGTVNQLFYKDGLVDELFLTVCPIILGQEEMVRLVQPPLPMRVELALKSSHVVGNLVFLKYKVQNQSRI